MSSPDQLVASPWLRVFVVCLAVAAACRSGPETGKLAADVRIPRLSYISSGGCANIVLYAGSQDRKEWLFVLAERRDLGFSTGTTSYDLAGDSVTLRVQVELFETPGDPEYCNDTPVEWHLPNAVWKARSGRITITLIGAEEGYKGGDAEAYTAQVRLDSCVFFSSDGRTKQQDSSIEMEAIVGYMPG